MYTSVAADKTVLIMRPGFPSIYLSPPIGSDAHNASKSLPTSFIEGASPKIPPFVGDGVLRNALILTAHISIEHVAEAQEYIHRR